MKALILAAGMGNRLGDLTNDKPKALVDVAGTFLIDRVLDFVNHPKVTEVAVVGGYHFETLSEHLNGRDVNLFHNTKFSEGNILTLMAALNFIDDDLLMLNVDHIYPLELLSHIIDNSDGLCAICDFGRKLGNDDMKVKLNGSKHLKEISKNLTDFDGGYIGMTYCSKEITDVYKDAIRDTYDALGNEACVESVLGNLANRNVEINICDTSGFRWLEVDTPEDLRHAEEILLKG